MNKLQVQRTSTNNLGKKKKQKKTRPRHLPQAQTLQMAVPQMITNPLLTIFLAS
jgi:hypothetical protein